jgi:hypothetical protein
MTSHNNNNNNNNDSIDSDSIQSWEQQDDTTESDIQGELDGVQQHVEPTPVDDSDNNSDDENDRAKNDDLPNSISKAIKKILETAASWPSTTSAERAFNWIALIIAVNRTVEAADISHNRLLIGLLRLGKKTMGQLDSSKFTNGASLIESALPALVADEDLRAHIVITNVNQIRRLAELVAPISDINGKSRKTMDERVLTLFDEELTPLFGLRCRVAKRGLEAFAIDPDYLLEFRLHLIEDLAMTKTAIQNFRLIESKLETVSSPADLDRVLKNIRKLSTTTAPDPVVPVARVAAITRPLHHEPQRRFKPSHQTDTFCHHCKRSGHDLTECRKLQRHFQGPLTASTSAPPKKGRPSDRSWTPTTRPSTNVTSRPIGAITSTTTTFTPFVPGIVNGQLASMLVDTGAQATVCSRKFASQYDCAIGPSESNLHTADGTPLQVLGETDIIFTLADGRNLPLRATVLNELFCDLIMGTDQMWNRADGLDVSIGRHTLAGAAENKQTVSVRFGSSGDWITPSESSTTSLAIVAIRTTDASVLAPPVLELDTVNEQSAVQPKQLPLIDLATNAQDALQHRQIYDASKKFELPEELTTPTSDDEAQPRYPVGPDVDAYKTVIDNIDPDMRADDTRAATERIVETITRHRTVWGGLKIDGCAAYPGVSRLPPMVIAMRPDMDIDTEFSAPVVHLSKEDIAAINKQTDEMLDLKMLEEPLYTPTLGAHAFRVAATGRMVVAFGKTNRCTWPNHYPLRSISALQRWASTFRFKAMFDVWAAFYQVPLDKRSRGLTAARFADRILQFRVVPMGIKQSPGHLQRVLEMHIRHHTDEWGIEVYIDDIIIGAHSADALADAIDWLLERCAELRLTLSCRKSTIGTHAMKVLGKMVKYHSIEPTAERIAAIRDYSQPTTVGELRSFLGMMAQIASHVLIHKIAEINLLHTAASNLHTSVSNVEWTPELSAAFNVVKDTASKPETLVPFDETRQVFLLCDASDDGYGAWLCHLAPDTNRLQPIDIFSGAWTAAQRNYTVPEKEAAALRLCCERWRYELLGRTTIVLCDNNAVVQLLANGTTSKAARVRNTIADMIGFDFVMLHIPTHENLVADVLSRDPRFGAAFADAARALSTTRATTEADELRVQSMAISLPVAPIVDIHSPSSATPPPPATAGIGAALDYLAPPFSDTRAALINLVEHQQRDPALATLRRVANNESLPTNPRPSPSIRRQWRRATQLKPFFDAAHAGALFVVPPGANYRRLVVPDGQRDNVIAEIHGPAHINAVATAKVAATLFWWPGMDAQIKNTIRGCAACQRVNAPRTRTPGNLGDVERDRVPIRLTEWEIDTFHVGHELGSGLAISVVERFSGFVMSKVVPSSSASDAIAAFTDLVLRPFGVPRRIFSDNGSEFLGAFAQELRRLGIEHIVGLPDNHHAVARVERHNRDRNNRLAHMYLRNGQRRPESNAALQHWLDIADTVANSIPTSSGYSPHELLFAQRRIVSVAALVPDDMLRAIADIGTDATTDLVSQIRLHQAALAVLDEARQDARIQQRAAIERAHGQQHAAPHVWQRGDLVLARTPRALRDGDDKLNSRLEFSGVWSVMSHDPVTERVVLRLTIPVPTSSAVDGPQIRTLDDTNTITVHSSDVRSFHDGSPLDSAHTVSPLHIGAAPPALNTPWHAPFTASDADARIAHTVQTIALRAAVKRLLTLVQEHRTSASLDRAIQAFAQPDQLAPQQAAAAAAPVVGGEHSSAIPIVVPEQAVRSPTTSTRAPRSTTIASTSTRTTRSSNRSSARKRYFYTGDSAGPFVQIEGISDDGLVVYGYVDMIDGRRTDGLVPVDRRIDDLCREDAALLARYRSPGE